MSVSSERSCTSPASSSDASSNGSGPMKLKRRWIEMSYVDEELHEKQTYRTPVDLSAKRPRCTAVKVITSTQNKKTPQSIYSEFSGKIQQQPRYSLPEDPRDWSKKDVLTWLKYMTTAYDLDVSPAKFDMNGKALCLMNMEMFVKRVPTGGKLMYRDFRLRLYPAVFFQKKPQPDYSKLTPLEMLAMTTGKYFP